MSQSVNLEDIVSLKTPTLVPEIPVYAADQLVALWRTLEVEEPPFWAFAWPGGQALARYTMDNPEIVANKHVLDFGAGTGINGIAAVLAHAKTVTFCDNIELSRELCELNCDFNALSPQRYSIVEEMPDVSNFDTVLLGDCFYTLELFYYINDMVDKGLPQGVKFYVGDPKREYFPERRCTKLASYSVTEMMTLERRAVMPSFVWELGGR